MLAPASLADSGSAASSDSTADSNANANANSKSILALQQTLLAATRKPQSFKASVVEMHRTASGRGLGEALGQGLEGSQQDNTEDNIDTNDDIDDDDEPMSELQCALEVGQYLLDQNTDLEAALRASRGETEWLLSVLANIDPDLVTEAMAAVQEEGGEQGSMVDKVAVAQEASGVSKLKAELMIAASELDELREQVEEMTTRNTELRLQNLEILMQHDTLKESINKRISTASGIPVEPSHTADLEDRIKEYDILVHQLKTQLAASRKQIADLKTGLKTPIATASPQSMASETSNLARISEPEGSRRMIPQQPHTPPYHR
ncbi:hypothetical protein BDR26DRAFT_40247 [Obelidium mucronatum]|nr:hypothetical protein BDR26DRAFT_40247 [Obelidium mucronatum]